MELTIKVAEGPLPLEISSTQGPQQRGTITAVPDAKSPPTYILWIKDPEKEEFQLLRISSIPWFINNSKPNHLVLMYPDEQVARELVVSKKIMGTQAPTTGPWLNPVPGWVLLDDPNVASDLKTKEFWSLDLSWALVRKRN